MAERLYSPQLSADVVRALYREARSRHIPMTRLADTLLRERLHELGSEGGISSVVRELPPDQPD